jgi:hypothetical protein
MESLRVREGEYHMADTGAPFWAAPALLAALLAASGYLGKLVTDSALEWRATALKRSARLVELYAMLRAGDAAFASQKDLRGRLGRRLSERLSKLGEQLPIQQDLRGYDALFSANFGRMEPEELKLHGLIRAYTVHTFKPLNDNLLDWLRSDAHFRGLPPNDPKYGAIWPTKSLMESVVQKVGQNFLPGCSDMTCHRTRCQRLLMPKRRRLMSKFAQEPHLS